MTDEKLRTLCEQIAKETDRGRLTVLIDEMENLLQHEQAEIKARIARNLNPHK